MTRTVATAHWRRLDHEGTDRCTLARVAQGWILSGQAVWVEEGAESALSYVVRCDEGWRTLSADVAGRMAGGEVTLRIQRDGDLWRMNDVPQVGCEGCEDIDLSFTPATNLMPLRRLEDGATEVTAAWLVPDLSRLSPLRQTYTPDPKAEAGTVLYRSPGFEARLSVHDSGFVTAYPALWEGWVDG